jgi:hypothetical protein
LLFKEVYGMLIHDVFFKGLINPKKYIILLLLSYFEEVHYMRIIRINPISSGETYKLKDEKSRRRENITLLTTKLKSYQTKAE